MFRSRHFYYMNVLDIKGRRIGFIKDLLIDFNRSSVIGFAVSSNSILKKRTNILIDNIIYYNHNLIVSQINRSRFLKFSEIKNMDVIDRNGNVIGITEDIIFDDVNFKIIAFVLSTGMLNNFLCGKKVILVNELMVGEKNILYFTKNNGINFWITPIKVLKDSNVNEKCR